MKAACGLLLAACLSASAEPPASPRVFLIGIDGATWDRIGPLAERGLLPNLSRLKREGASGILGSNGLSSWGYSPVIWTSMATGKTPDAHGIDGFVSDDDRRVPSSQRRVKAIWNILSGHHLRVLTVGYLVTWPVEAVEGAMVSDQFVRTELPDRVYPPDILKDYGPAQAWDADASSESYRLKRFMDFDYQPQFWRSLPKDSTGYAYNENILGHLAWVYMRDESLTRAAENLLPRVKPRCFAIHLWGVDHTSHGFWSYSHPERFPVTAEERRRFGGVIDRYYQYADEVVGRLLRFAGPGDVVLVVSDHGFTDAHDRSRPVPGKPIQNSGEHHPDGVFIAAGGPFRAGAAVTGATIYDIMPTLLYLYGLPIARDMPGKLLAGAFKPGVLKSRPPQWVASYEAVPRRAPGTASSSELLPQEKAMLKALGYIH